MKKIVIPVLISGLLITGLVVGITLRNSSSADPAPAAVPTTVTPAGQNPGYKDVEFKVESRSIRLVNGVHSIEAAPGSASTISIRYFGNEAFGDLNGDGREDAVFLVTQNSGGSGAFYYLVAALRTGSGWLGINAVYLGDRIATHPTIIQNGAVVVVNYADRKPGEPFTAIPSVELSKNLRVVDGKLVEVQVPTPLTSRKWTWVNSQTNDGKLVSPKKASAFTLTFKQNGTVAGTTDCNSFGGQYQAEGVALSFSRMASTLMACEGSQESEYLKSLGEVYGFFIEKDVLVLALKSGLGSMTFK